MLEKKVIIGLITILEDKSLQIREDTVIYENNIEISRTYNRYISNPGDDVSGKPQIIKDISELLWTTEVIQTWKDKLAESANRLSGLNNG